MKYSRLQFWAVYWHGEYPETLCFTFYGTNYINNIFCINAYVHSYLPQYLAIERKDVISSMDRCERSNIPREIPNK